GSGVHSTTSERGQRNVRETIQHPGDSSMPTDPACQPRPTALNEQRPRGNYAARSRPVGANSLATSQRVAIIASAAAQQYESRSVALYTRRSSLVFDSGFTTTPGWTSARASCGHSATPRPAATNA